MTHIDYWTGFQTGYDAGSADGFKKGMRFVSSASYDSGDGGTCGGGPASTPGRGLRDPRSKEAAVPGTITLRHGSSVPRLDLEANRKPGGRETYSRLEPAPLGIDPSGPRSGLIFSKPVPPFDMFRLSVPKLHPPLGLGGLS